MPEVGSRSLTYPTQPMEGRSSVRPKRLQVCHHHCRGRIAGFAKSPIIASSLAGLARQEWLAHDDFLPLDKVRIILFTRDMSRLRPGTSRSWQLTKLPGREINDRGPLLEGIINTYVVPSQPSGSDAVFLCPSYHVPALADWLADGRFCSPTTVSRCHFRPGKAAARRSARLRGPVSTLCRLQLRPRRYGKLHVWLHTMLQSLAQARCMVERSQRLRLVSRAANLSTSTNPPSPGDLLGKRLTNAGAKVVLQVFTSL